ncbi:hypothetical protein RI129_003049 [Pyrocoelia pectoralis]|uniref:PiggyBac transposable element-derived protein domain-containing protein n=1 Tax=Pyrocoelia pectoralis TaxID=417401 RepID=A0AAN7ZMQ6_9COLE
MDRNVPGPSSSKKPKLSKKTPLKKYLTHDELEKLLYESDDDFDESYLVKDVDEESSGEEDVSQTENLGDDEDRACEESIDDMDTVEEGESSQSPQVICDEPAWSDTPDLLDIPFTKTNEFLWPFPGSKPIDIFNFLVDDTFYQKIVEETNAYAEDVLLEQGFLEYSRISRWKPVTIEELKIFFSLILHTGTIHLPRLKDYWKTDRLFNIPSFRDSMGRDRFFLILRCLHFSKNPTKNEPKPEDRLFKIRPLIHYFNNKINDTYYPTQNLSIDESMMLYRGRLSFRQYIPNKRHKYGIKFYMLTEPDGLILKFLIYTGNLADAGGKGHAANVVLHLLEGKLDQGHCVFMDNYYNSFTLSRQLLERKTHTTGTLRIDRKYSPKSVKEAKLKKGETVAKYANNVMIGKWRDKRDVTYISTEFKNNLQTFFNKRGKEVSKPLPVLKYNNYMGGVDRQDQFMSYYPCRHKSLRWYKKVAIHVYQLLLLNSFFLYKKYVSPRATLYDFRLQIIAALLPEKPKETVNFPTHLLTQCPKDGKGKILRKRCASCSQRGVRKDTSLMCRICKVGLCLEPCFELYHQNMQN